MARRAIPVSTKVEFFNLLDQGYGVADASRAVGVARETGYFWKKNGLDLSGNVGAMHPSGPELRRRKVDLSLSDPVSKEWLIPEAKRALEDFDYFRQRYFGRRATPWQTRAADEVKEALATPHDEYLVINEPPGSGKALAVDTPMLTVDRGWTTMGDLRPGDRVYDDRGWPCVVVAKSEVFTDHDCYTVTSDDGATVVADAGHLWPVRLHGWVPKPDYPGKTGPKPAADGVHAHTTEFLAKPRSKRPQLAMGAPLRYHSNDLPVDPYVLGVWLGDGSSEGARIAADPEDAKHLRAEIEAAGYITGDTSRPTAFSVSTGTRDHTGSFTSLLKTLGVWGNKHVPEQYLLSGAGHRLALLRGLIDTDGYVGPTGHVEFCNTNRALAEAVQFLVRSLGRKASLSEGRATLDGRDCGPKYRVMFYMAGCASMPRKAVLTRDAVRTPNRYLTVTPTERVPVQCIQVDSPSRCYLAGRGLLVTHNSTLFTGDLPCWFICQDRSTRGLIGSSTGRLAEKYSNRIRRTLERTRPLPENPLQGRVIAAEAALSQDFGRFRGENGLWTRQEFVVAQFDSEGAEDKEPTVAAYGMDSEFLGHRANWVIWDDLVTRAVLRNQEMIEAQRAWWTEEGETRLEPGGVLLLVGQRMSADDLYRYCLDMEIPEELVHIVGREKKYRHIVFPAHFDDECKGDHSRDAKPWPDGCLLDPVRLPWTKLATVERNRGSAYRVQYQQEEVDPAEVLVPKLWVDGGTDPKTGEVFPGCWDKDRDAGVIPAGLAPPLISFATADPSPTKFWSIQWWVYQPATNQRFLIDLIRQQMDSPDFLDWNEQSRVFHGVMDEWQSRSKDLNLPITHWIVEANAAQRFILQYDHVRRWQRTNGVQIIAHQTHRNKSDPDYGIQMLKNLWRFGQVRLPGYMQGRLASLKLVDEVTRYPQTTTDDCLMAEWFGEYHIANGALHRFTDHEPTVLRRPSWMRKKIAA